MKHRMKHRMAGRGRIENLRPPWKPGQSGNLSGRPKKRPITERYAYFLEVPVSDRERIKRGLPKGATYGDAIALGQMKRAITNTQAAREIREAIEGRALQAVRIEEIEGDPSNSENQTIDDLKRNILELTEQIRARGRERTDQSS
jgi:hypothetical protein